MITRITMRGLHNRRVISEEFATDERPTDDEIQKFKKQATERYDKLVSGRPPGEVQIDIYFRRDETFSFVS